VDGGVTPGASVTGTCTTYTGEQTDASTGLEYLRARYYCEVALQRSGAQRGDPCRHSVRQQWYRKRPSILDKR
jgi:hypothetical protein